MTQNIIDEIKAFFDTVEPFTSHVEDGSWFQKEKERFDWENQILKNLSCQLELKFGKFYSVKNLRTMSKLYQLYPDGLPQELNALSWGVIRILMTIFDEAKRDFYVDLCYLNGLSKKALCLYLKQNIYEKFLYCMQAYCDGDAPKTIAEYEEMIHQVIILEAHFV